jgi:hypothetical protein
VSEALDLWILDAGAQAVAVGRRGSDMAIGRLPLDTAFIAELEAFRDRLDGAVRGAVDAPRAEELASYGSQLFTYALSERLGDVYGLLPAAYGRISIFSDQSRIQRLPWEYLGFPRLVAGHPVRERSVVRIVPTCGRPAPVAKKLSGTVRVLFVSAAPRDQDVVDFEAVAGAIQRAFQSWLPPEGFTIEVVDGATRESFNKALRKRFDILHFSGHGRVDGGKKGQLLLVDRKTGRTDAVDAEHLCTSLNGKDLSLVVLSACETASGNFDDDFSVVAEALVRSGIPAVVANQLPVTNQAMAAFVGPLYAELLQSGDIDRAVMEGRITLDVVLKSFEWGIPTLYRHYGASQLYEP